MMMTTTYLTNIIRKYDFNRLLMKKLYYSDRVSSRDVSTVSPLPLLNKFNRTQTKVLSFNALRQNVGLFRNSRLTKPEGFHVSKENAIRKTEELVTEALNPECDRKLVEIFDDLSDNLCQVADLAEFIRIAHPSNAYCAAAEDAAVGISGLVEKLNTNVQLYKALKKISTDGDKISTTATDQHVVELFLHDFEQSGIHLSDINRKRVVYLNEYILYLGSIFMREAQQPRVYHQSNVDKSIRHFFPRDGENLLVTGLFSDCPDEKARETAYRLYLQENSKQSDILDQLLTYRHELAILCGFPSYVHRAVKGSIADSPEMISDFLTKLSDAIKPYSTLEFNELCKIKNGRSNQVSNINYFSQCNEFPTEALKC